MNQPILITSHCHQRCNMSSVADANLTPNGSISVEEKMNSYIVSRNGVILSWPEIYQQYPLANDNDSRSGNSSNTSETRDPQQHHYKPMEASSLLQRLPRGAYTTCRTVKAGTHIYQFDYHVKRLAVSSASILQTISAAAVATGDDAADAAHTNKKSNIQESNETMNDLLSKTNHPRQHHRNPSAFESQTLNIVNEGWERHMALNCIRLTLDAFRSTYTHKYNSGGSSDDDDGDEYRITLLATWEQQKKEDPFKSVLYCHVGLLSNNNASSKQKNIRVLIHGHGRTNASAKDSKWVMDRKQLLSSPSSNNTRTNNNNDGYEEIILMNHRGELLEGTQTNFYVVINENTIVTANEGVLFGSVRDSVLRVCRQHDITVELRSPTLKDLQCASGVFITSTSRWVMPVHEVDLGDLLLLNGRNGRSSNDCLGSLDESLDKKKKQVVNALGDDDVTTYRYHNCLTTERIRAWVLEDVETHSTLINA